MSHITITNIEDHTVKGVLTNNRNEFAIPVRFTGGGLTHFNDHKAQGKSVSINPSMINLIKNNAVASSMVEVKLTKMFGKILLEGISTTDWCSPVIVDTADIKEFWTESFKSDGSVWNIEV